MVHGVEHGRPASLETYARIGTALALELRLDLIDPRRRVPSARAEDPVHAAMGECLASRLASFGFEVALDEPYQHYQFAGRADVLAWDRDGRALLHVENRTRFPNLQEALGSYNAKRRYLPGVMAARLAVEGGFGSVTNVIAGLWSSEVIHVVRLRRVTFEATCPNQSTAFAAWWAGELPHPGPPTSSFVLLDPNVGNERRRSYVDLGGALSPSLRPRFRGYADAVAAAER